MSEISLLVKKKKWSLSPKQTLRLVQLVEKFQDTCLDSHFRLRDISLYPGYFTTLVFELKYVEGLSNGNERKIKFFVKLATLPKKWEQRWRERIKYEYDCTAQIYNLFKDSNFCETVKPIAHFEEEAGFVMGEIKGERLDKMLSSAMLPVGAKSPEKLMHAMHEAGRWIAAFQEKMPASEKGVFTRVDLESRIDKYLKSVADETQGILPHRLTADLGKKTQQVLDDFRESDFAITAKHNDYAPWNAMLGENGFIAFDFADCESDSKYYDVYHFTRAINSFKLKPFYKTDIIEKSKLAFFDGYSNDIILNSPTRIYFNIYFSIERVQMLLRGRRHNTGVKGKLKNLSQKRHLNWYLKELHLLTKR